MNFKSTHAGRPPRQPKEERRRGEQGGSPPAAPPQVQRIAHSGMEDDLVTPSLSPNEVPHGTPQEAAFVLRVFLRLWHSAKY